MRLLQNISTRPVVTLAFGAGRLVAGGSGGFDVWDLAGGERAHIPLSGASTPGPCCAVDPRGRWFCTTDWKIGFRLFPLDGGEPARLPGDPTDQHVAALALSPDGTRLVVSRGARASRVECWEVGEPWRLAWAFRDGEPCGEGPFFSEGRGWRTTAAAFSPDGRRVGLLEGRWDERTERRAIHLVLRDAATGKRVGEMPAGVAPLPTLRFLPDGKRLAGLSPTAVEVWSPAGKRRMSRTLAGRSAPRAVAAHPAGASSPSPAGPP